MAAPVAAPAGTVADDPAPARTRLATLPTPLQPAPRLSETLGVEVWLKRDDLTGLGLGGNKVRMLEFLLGAARAEGYDVLVTGAGPQSNWAFLAALAAGREGLDVHLAFYGGPPHDVTGNLLLQGLTGATVHYTGESDRASVDVMLTTLADRLRRQGRRPLVLPRGGATARGSLGYVLAAEEIAGQLGEHAGLARPTVWLATGSCGTQAGLSVGTAAGHLGRVVGVTVSRPVEECRARVLELGCGAARLLGLPQPTSPDIDVRGGWLGAGYGVPSPDGEAAARLVARTEGVLLDPVFGAKAMAALVDAARRWTEQGPVVFLVSGGAPTLFMDRRGKGQL